MLQAQLPLSSFAAVSTQILLCRSAKRKVRHPSEKFTLISLLSSCRNKIQLTRAAFNHFNSQETSLSLPAIPSLIHYIQTFTTKVSYTMKPQFLIQADLSWGGGVLWK